MGYPILEQPHSSIFPLGLAISQPWPCKRCLTPLKWTAKNTGDSWSIFRSTDTRTIYKWESSVAIFDCQKVCWRRRFLKKWHIGAFFRCMSVNINMYIDIHRLYITILHLVKQNLHLQHTFILRLRLHWQLLHCIPYISRTARKLIKKKKHAAWHCLTWRKGTPMLRYICELCINAVPYVLCCLCHKFQGCLVIQQKNFEQPLVKLHSSPDWKQMMSTWLTFRLFFFISIFFRSHSPGEIFTLVIGCAYGEGPQSQNIAIIIQLVYHPYVPT